MQVPEIPAPVEYMMRRTPDESGYIAGVPRRWWDTRQSWVYGRLGDIPDGVVLVDAVDLFCDHTTCRAAEGDIFLYFDQNHLSPAGQDRVARHVLQQVDQGFGREVSSQITP
ncbi:MAG: SGNH hydrolase domain-containing protein, partial [Pseudomonadota bacterium]